MLFAPLMTAPRLFVLTFLAGACAKETLPPATSPPPDTGVADVPFSAPAGEVGAITPDTTPGPDRRPNCPAGATDDDCQLCEFGGETCQRACPKVNCDVYPPPAACTSFCGRDDCCECRLDVGTEYWWRRPDRPIKCGTQCEASRAAWQTLLKDPRMKACQVDADCVQAGGPSPASCDCRPAIGGCYTPVNGGFYQSSGAAALEQQYLATCGSQSRVCDCAPGVPGCENGACVMKKQFCCLCPPDAGP
jgi:hypothetical protein